VTSPLLSFQIHQPSTGNNSSRLSPTHLLLLPTRIKLALTLLLASSSRLPTRIRLLISRPSRSRPIPAPYLSLSIVIASDQPFLAFPSLPLPRLHLFFYSIPLSRLILLPGPASRLHLSRTQNWIARTGGLLKEQTRLEHDGPPHFNFGSRTIASRLWSVSHACQKVT
jgi:hypothetical protein